LPASLAKELFEKQHLSFSNFRLLLCLPEWSMAKVYTFHPLIGQSLETLEMTGIKLSYSRLSMLTGKKVWL
jgi:hypothetical protein